MSDRAPYSIRPACPEDADTAIRLWACLGEHQARLDPTLALADDAPALWATEFHDLVGAASGCLLVAEAEGAVVGLAAAHLREAPPLYTPMVYAFLDAVVVDASWRRRGIARDLVRAVQRWAAAAGAQHLEARLVAASDAARGFWADVGAGEVARTVRMPTIFRERLG